MWTWIKEIWSDKTAARVVFISLITFGGAFYLQPRDRDPWERAFGAGMMTFVTGGAALSSNNKVQP